MAYVEDSKKWKDYERQHGPFVDEAAPKDDVRLQPDPGRCVWFAGAALVGIAILLGVCGSVTESDGVQLGMAIALVACGIILANIDLVE